MSFDPLRAEWSSRNFGEDTRVKLMFRDQHSFGERGGGVPGHHRDLDLAKYLARIELIGDEVNCRPRRLVAFRQSRLVSPEAFEFRQQGRVDVEDPALPSFDEVVRNDPHEAGDRKSVV